MTAEALTAVKNGYQMEIKKDALKQVQSGDVKVTFTINPEDMPSELYSDPMGQRYMAVIVPLNDDETPREKSKSYAQQAKMLAKDLNFGDYWKSTVNIRGGHPPRFELMEEFIEEKCGVKSCSELIEGTEAARKFKNLQREYLQWRDN